MNVSERLADFILSLDYDKLPAQVQSVVSTAMYNFMGCLYAGTKEPVVEIVRSTIQTSASGCKLAGTDLFADPASAALHNGTAGNAIAFDDMYAGGIFHPGVATITGAMVAAQLHKVSGKEFLTAVVAGYEIADHIARMVNPSQYKYWHTACTAGVFGAMAAAGRIMGLTREQLVSAFGVAGTQACGLQECSDNMAIRLHHGIAARNGVTAVLLAKAGFDGPKRIFEGKGGYVAATSEFDGDIMAQFDQLGEKFLICDTSFKYYPCCGHIHACIDGALFAQQKSGVRVEDIQKVKVGTYKTAAMNDSNPTPQNMGQAKFSIEYCVAVGLLNGKATLEEFSQWPPAQEVLDLMEKVEVTVNPEIESTFPMGMRGAVVTLVTSQGEVTEKRDTRRGDPACPLSKDDIRVKFRSLAGQVLTAEQLEEMDGLLEHLEELENASVLCRY